MACFRALLKDEEGLSKVADALVKRERFCARRFVQFFEEYLPSGFEEQADNTWDWERDVHSEQFGDAPLRRLTVAREHIPAVLKRIYNRRSGLIHSAEPFPMETIDRPTFAEASYARGAGELPDLPGDLIPHVRWFERGVNAALNACISELTHATDGDAGST